MLFDKNLWEEYEKNLPPPNRNFQFYIGFVSIQNLSNLLKVCGIDQLSSRIREMRRFYDTTNRGAKELTHQVEELARKYDMKLSEDVS